MCVPRWRLSSTFSRLTDRSGPSKYAELHTLRQAFTAASCGTRPAASVANFEIPNSQPHGIREPFDDEASQRVGNAGELRDETMRDDVVHQFGGRVKVHLLEDARAVGADGLDAQRQFLGDLRNGAPGADQPQNLVLTIREQ
jgi:NADPH-dependent 2,4-dienoyl-CoA reductase/sulfur reductase-like enzyme